MKRTILKSLSVFLALWLLLTCAVPAGASTYVQADLSSRNPDGFRAVSSDNNTQGDSDESGSRYVFVSSATVMSKAVNGAGYTLHYDANGGEGGPADQTGDTRYVIPSDEPTLSGYVFLGWSDSATATTPKYTADDTIALSGNMTLYAVWAVDPNPPVTTTYTLSYDANGGTGAPAKQTGSTQYTVSSTVPVYSEYLFLGWSTSRTAKTAQYKAGDPITLDSDTTLYAVWQRLADAGSFSVSPMSVRFYEGGSAVFTCTVIGFSDMDYYPSVSKLNGSKLSTSWAKWENRSTVKLTVSGNTPCSETLLVELFQADTDVLLGSEEVSVTVMGHTESFTVSPENVAINLGKSATITCTYTGLDDQSNYNINAIFDEEYLQGEWSEDSESFTLTAKKTGTTTVYFELSNRDTEELLMTKSVEVTVKTGFFRMLWNIISFPFKIIFYPIIWIISLFYK